MGMLFTVLATTLLQGQAETDRDIEKLRFLVNVYQANRDATAFGRFRFTETVGLAQDLADARAGRLTQAVAAAGFYTFDGADARFERTMSDADLVGATKSVGENTTSAPISCLRGLADGQSALVELFSAEPASKTVIKTTQIFPVEDFYRSIFFPLDLGRPMPRGRHLPDDVEGIIAGRLKLLSLDTEANYEGRSVVHFVVAMEDGERAYWVDPERGAIPLLIRSRANASGYVVWLANDDIRLEPNGAWVPRIMTRFAEDPGAARLVRRVAISDVNVERRPDRMSTFRLDFSKPLPLIDTVKKVRYAQRKSWSLLELPAVSSSQAVPIPMVEDGPPAFPMPGERDPEPAWYSALLAAAAILLVAAGLRLWRTICRARH